MKRLIICCDGTWNKADQAQDGRLCPTNVVKLGTRLATRDGTTPQVIHYNQGVGTGNFLDRWRGGAFGFGLDENIYDAYRFLIANYERDDELFLFGFSRGAFTARSLAGMIRNCGILRRTSAQRYLDAISLYRDPRIDPRHPDARQFRKDHSVAGDSPIPIRFMGVWDTVGSLGIPLRGLRWLTAHKYQFHDTALSGSVRHACHALAIDEHRTPFKPTLWQAQPKEGQAVEQVWFAGAHSDVGGGYRDNALSDITLEWMMQRARTAGLVFDDDVTQALPTRPDPLGTLHNSMRGLYRLTRGINRSIGGDATESVHPTALARWDADENYRPEPLRAYLSRTEDPRVATA